MDFQLLTALLCEACAAKFQANKPEIFWGDKSITVAAEVHICSDCLPRLALAENMVGSPIKPGL